MKLTANEALIATAAIGAMMLLLRSLPFLVFAKKNPPRFFSFIKKFIPPVSIAVLFAVCLKSETTDLIFSSVSPKAEFPSIFCTLLAGIMTAILHLWKKNAMLSIFGGTILYMILNYFF